MFDLIIGSAILHHLVDPFAALVNITSSLKPGGKIVLIEPMEAGCLLLTIIYERVLEFFQKRGEITHKIANLMRAMRTDIHARLGVPQQHDWTKYLDDKWVFNRVYLAQLTEKLGLSIVQVFPNQLNLTHVYEESFRSLLSDTGNTGIQIPEEVFEIFREFDEGIHPDLKEWLCPTGIILITK